MELSSLFETSFVIVALMLVGFLGVRRGVLTRAFSRTASFLIVNVFIVGTIFQSVCSGGEGISPAELPHILLMVTLMNTLCYVLGRAALRLFVDVLQLLQQYGQLILAQQSDTLEHGDVGH